MPLSACVAVSVKGIPVCHSLLYYDPVQVGVILRPGQASFHAISSCGLSLLVILIRFSAQLISRTMDTTIGSPQACVVVSQHPFSFGHTPGRSVFCH
jgi:hypothetical protein